MSESDAATLSAQVAAQLRERIVSGRLQPGSRLPSESELARDLAVSRTTLRGALEELQREGLISKQQGLRSMVRSRRVQQALAQLESIDEVMDAHGLSSSMQVVRYTFEQPAAEIQQALHLVDGTEVLAVRRVHLVQEEPIAVVDLAVRADLAAEFSRRDIESQPFFRLFPTRLNIQLGRATQTIRAEAATPADATALWVEPATPVLVCDRVTQSIEGEPMIYASFHYRADRYEFRANIEVHERRVSWALPGLSLVSHTTLPLPAVADQGASA